MIRIIILLVGALYWPGSANALEERASTEEALAFLEKAVSYAREVGLTEAKKAFQDPSGPFIDRDLYVYCVGPTGRFTVHPIVPALVGVNFLTLRDPNGKLFGRELFDETNSKGSATVTYVWTHPRSRMLEPKIAYSRKIEDEFCAVGAYLPPNR